MLDGFCRTIDYIRISVTDRCNLRCRYCMPPEGITCLPMHEILSYEETIHLCRIFAELGVRKVKITGGEPFVRRNVCHLIRAIKDIPGIDSVTITTNGILALQHLKELKAIGIDGINFSLDSRCHRHSQHQNQLCSRAGIKHRRHSWDCRFCQKLSLPCPVYRIDAHRSRKGLSVGSRIRYPPDP